MLRLRCSNVVFKYIDGNGNMHYNIDFPVDPMRPHVPGTYLPDAPACARHSIMVVEVSPSAE